MTKSRGVDGTRWAVMKVFDIPDAEDPTQVYLRRWRVLQTPYFGIYLHKINMTDGDRDMHDHPWAMLSFILKGGYIEEYVGTREAAIMVANGEIRSIRKAHFAHRVHYMPRGAFHAIRTLVTKPTWTLCLVGPRMAEDWGFATADGFMRWQDYNKQKFGSAVAQVKKPEVPATLQDACHEIMALHSAQGSDLRAKYEKGMASSDILDEIRSRWPGSFPLCTWLDVHDCMNELYGPGRRD